MYSEIGEHMIKIKLSDGEPLYNEYEIKVTVTNSAPIFTSGEPEDLVVSLNQDFYYQLPPFEDPE